MRDLGSAHVAKAPFFHDDRRPFLAFTFFEHRLEAVDVLRKLFRHLVGIAQHQCRIGFFMGRLLELRHLATSDRRQPLLGIDPGGRAGQAGEKAVELGKVEYRIVVAVGDQQVFEAVEFFFAEGGEHGCTS
ncbi:hypothetical protein D3C81_1629570 [compost metagenome]